MPHINSNNICINIQQLVPPCTESLYFKSKMCISKGTTSVITKLTIILRIYSIQSAFILGGKLTVTTFTMIEYIS